jgi:hypothetical protein
MEVIHETDEYVVRSKQEDGKLTVVVNAKIEGVERLPQARWQGSNHLVFNLKSAAQF